MVEMILASKSKVRKQILDENKIKCRVEPSNVDEDIVKDSLIKEKATPTTISKNLAELKASKVSLKNTESLVLGADSVIDLEGELISKPENREEAYKILQKLNGKKHNLVSSVCICKNGSMIWNHSDSATLTMKKFTDEELKNRIANDPHSPGMYRVNGPLMNCPEFFDAFGVKEGESMRNSEDKISKIW